MPSDPSVPGEITAMLRRWNTGEREALAQLVSLTYRDLHAIAAGYLRHENRGHTLQATGLVSELYIRLTRQREVPVSGRRHFYTFAAMVMRGILSDYARQAHALKRPGGASVRVPLHEDMAWIDASGEDMLSLDEALRELEARDERKVRVIELRYFLGCTNDETAELLGIARATVDRDLQFAKAWLFRRLSQRLSAAKSTTELPLPNPPQDYEE